MYALEKKKKKKKKVLCCIHAGVQHMMLLALVQHNRIIISY